MPLTNPPATPGCLLYHSVAQSIGTGAWTSLAFNSEFYDTDSFHDTATNNSRVTVPAGLTGTYQFTAAAQFASNATGLRGLRLQVDGSILQPAYWLAPAVSGAATGMFLTWTLRLTAGQYAEVQVFQSSGGNLNADGGGSAVGFSASYLGV